MRSSAGVLLVLLTLVTARQERPPPPASQGFYPRPPAHRPSGAGGGTDLGSLLEGVQPNVLDAKLIGLGYVREDLVAELCVKATRALISEGQDRANSELGSLQAQVTDLADRRCSQLVTEAQAACDDVLRQIQDRFGSALGDAMREGDTQCDAAKQLTLEMVRQGAEQSYIGQRDLGRQLAEAEFRRQVEEEKNRGERMFQEQVEKQREEGEQEFRRQIEEGRLMAETNFTQLVEEGKVEGEEQFDSTIAEERAKAEVTFQETVDRERARAEEVFLEQVILPCFLFCSYSYYFRWRRAGRRRSVSSRRRQRRVRRKERRCVQT